MSAPPELPSPSARERSPALIVAGSLMLAAGLLLANPHGATDTRWPWQILTEWPWTRRHANWALWFALAILSVVLGSVGTRRARAPVLFGGALLLFVTCCAGDAGLALQRYHVAWFAGLTLLFAGYLLEMEGRWQAAARASGVLGAALVLVTLAFSFDRSAEGVDESRLFRMASDVFTRVRGQGVPDAPPDHDMQLFANSTAIVAALLAFASLVGLRGGLVARIGMVLVLLHYLVPTFHKLGTQIGAQVGGELEHTTVYTTLSEVLVHYGLALTLFTAAAAADLARLQTRPT